MRIAFVIYLCLQISAATGQSNAGMLKGMVTAGKENEPVIGAEIRLYDETWNEKAAAVSDLDGNFTITAAAGNYSTICRFTGMRSDTVKVQIVSDETVRADFKLIENDQILEQVVVTAGKFEQKFEDLTVSMEVIKPHLIENRNTTSIETALEQTPGLTIMDSEPQIRGGSGFTFGVGSRVAIVVDGMPLTTGDAGRPEWGFVPVENIEQIEVIKGASSVLYGSSALSGVINIRTAYPRLEPQTTITLNSGLYSAPAKADKWWNNTPLYGGVSFMHSRIVRKQLDVVVAGNYFYDHGYIGPPGLENHPTVIDTLTQFTEEQLSKTRFRLNFNLRYRFKKIKGLDVGLNGNGMYANTNFALAWLDDSTNIYRAYPGAISLQTQKIFHLDPFVNYYSKSGLKQSLRMRVFITDNQITNNQSNSSTLLFTEYQMQRKFNKIPGLNFTGGAVIMRTSSKAQLYAGDGDSINFITNASGYAQIDKKSWDVFNVSAGLRMEYFKMNEKESIVKPILRAGASLQVTEGTIIRASYGQGFRFPTIAERFILTNIGTFGVFPNPDLQPETSTNIEFAIKQGFKLGPIGGYLDIAGFYQDYENTIEYLFGVWDMNVAPLGFKFLNTGKTRVKGLDVSLIVGTAKKQDWQITVLAGYTYTLPQSLEPDKIYATDSAPAGPRPLSYNSTSMDSTGQILKYRYQHSGKADLDVTYKNLSFGYSIRFYGSMKNIDDAFELMEELTALVPQFANFYGVDYWKNSRNGFWLHDARIGYRFKIKAKELKISAVVNNILNLEYALRPVKIESPRTTALQIVYKF
jgi:iron complex outermembrane receptor protein